ncbi:MAG TPA: metallopeptidase family protein [Candidatus Saccharimonadales bacterium]|nr:metallopeptidase family protein [Candidatus Saccharimonadales bacterium]
MIQISQAEFERYINDGIAALPSLYQKKIDNVAFLVEDYPTAEQRVRLNLYPNETLFGLYEGVPLPRRNGTLKLLPDKITIFKKPMEAVSQTHADVAELVRHTIWHEVAHYYGLDHDRIHQLER